MPIFDFSTSGISINKTGQWVYWVVTVPLTTAVLAAYLSYLVWAKSRNLEEDRKARNEPPQNRFSESEN